MTLKNNHLIVETEERNDIEEDSRETTMKYSPGARDGVFVVEVQQGLRRSPGSGGPVSATGTDQEVSVSMSDQCALVHNPPDRYSDDETLEDCDDADYYVETTSPSRQTCECLVRTGLAQSDSNLASPRYSYCYTNQQCYDNGSYGYAPYNGYVNDEPPLRAPQPESSKPKITAALFKKQFTSDLTFDEDDVTSGEQQSRLGNSKQHIQNDGEAPGRGPNDISTRGADAGVGVAKS